VLGGECKGSATIRPVVVCAMRMQCIFFRVTIQLEESPARSRDSGTRPIAEELVFNQGRIEREPQGEPNGTLGREYQNQPGQ